MDKTKYYVYNEDGEAVRVAQLYDDESVCSIQKSKLFQRIQQQAPINVADAEEAPI